jgi:hypothetical protein
VSSDADKSNTLEPIFPVIELSTIEALYSKFVTHVKRSVDKTKFPEKYATRAQWITMLSLVHRLSIRV